MLVNSPPSTVKAITSNLAQAFASVSMSGWRAIAFVAALYAGSVSAAPECGSVELAGGSEAYSDLLSTVDALILSEGFGCSVELVEANTKDTLAAWLKQSTTAVISAMSVNSSGQPSAIADAAWLQSINDQPVTEVGEGWWITQATVELHPELKTVLDVLEHPELFAVKNNPATGTFVGCPLNTDCANKNANLFRAFQMQDKGWTLTTPDTMDNLDSSLGDAIELDQNWFGYQRSPSAVIGRFNLSKLDFGIEFTGDKNWNGCIARETTDCNDPKPSAWRPLQLRTFVTEAFATSVPTEVMAYLSTRELPGHAISSLLAIQQDEKLDTEATAKVFLQQYGDVWGAWMSADIAAKITEAVSTPH